MTASEMIMLLAGLTLAGLLWCFFFGPRKVGQAGATPVPEEVTDPVCAMTISPSKAAAQAEYLNTTYYFCSTGCRDTFTANPSDFVTTPNHAHH